MNVEYIFSHVGTLIFSGPFRTRAASGRVLELSLTSLFAGDITENFFVIPTFDSKDTIDKGPAFIESIKTDSEFLKLEERKDEWWFALDSKSVLDNEEVKITKFSFEQMNALYKKILKSFLQKELKIVQKS